MLYGSSSSGIGNRGRLLTFTGRWAKRIRQEERISMNKQLNITQAISFNTGQQYTRSYIRIEIKITR